MKILAIIGSPRKANTYHTIQKIEQIHEKIFECEYEYLFLKDINLGQCKGCFNCISKGEQYCPLKDDRDLIMKKIESADGVILASPNYVANVSGLMKNFIDRFAYTMHRPKYFNQKFMLVIASGSYMGVKSAMKSLSVIVSGGKIISNLAVFNSPEINEKKQKSQELKIKKSAKKFAKMLSKKTLTKPSISFLIWFSVFKASSVINKKGLPADYEYYKDKKYFTECELNSFQKATIKVFTQFFGFLLQKGLI